MNEILKPWQLLFAIFAGWVHRRQQQIIEFQNSQIISLMQSQGKKRQISDTTVKDVLKTHGIEPAADWKHTGTWSTFLKSHSDVLAQSGEIFSKS